MKKAICIFVSLVVLYSITNGQTANTDDGPQMGFHDFGLSLGHMGMAEHKNYLQNTSSEIKTTNNFFTIHMSESILSNWWNADDNTRFLIGIREAGDVGLGRQTRTETIDYPTGSSSESINKLNIIFTYEGGLGALYRINKKMDVAFNYFFISISSFNKTTDLVKNVPQFKFRYSHYMAEMTLHARTAFEFKYLPDAGDDLQTYFGLSLTYWKKNADAINTNTIKTYFLQLTCGWQM